MRRLHRWGLALNLLAFGVVTCVFLGVGLRALGNESFSLGELLSKPRLVKLEACYLIALSAGFWLANRLVAVQAERPYRELGLQLDALDPRNPLRRLWLGDAEGPETQLLEQLNGLLGRVHLAAMQVEQYSTQVAHELRTPLTLLRLRVEKAAESMEPRVAEQMTAEIEGLLLQVERALLLARAEQGYLTLAPCAMDLRAVVESLGEGFSLLAAERDRALHLSGPAVEVNADPVYLKQIIYNLLTNALRHGQGDIHLRTRRSRSGAALLVVNRRAPLDSAHEGLGIGLRLITALVRLQRGMAFRHRRSATLYCALLRVEQRDFH